MKVKCDIQRSDQEGGVGERYSTYILEVEPTETVLGVLMKIHRTMDPSLAFRFACGVVKCGECAVEVNGSPCLACEEVVKEEMRMRPLPKLPVVKDLVVDRKRVFDQIFRHIPQLFCIAEGAELRDLGADNIDKFIQMTRCFECLMCQSVCPLDPCGEEGFVGPLGLVWLAQMALNPKKRFLIEQEIDASLKKCLRCGTCSEVCPCPDDIIGLAISILEEGSSE
jgi:succinate dehydrogenase/fumarate reductase iron-sulfur protein